MLRKMTWIGLLIFIIMTPFMIASAETSGTCGNNLEWILDETGCLTISGSGDMQNYSSSSNNGIYETSAPWGVSICKVIIDEGVTSIGSFAFTGCTSLSEIELPEGLKKIGSAPFSYCTNLSSIMIPDGVTGFDSISFSNCSAYRYANIDSDAAKALGQVGYSFRPMGTNYDLQYLFIDQEICGLNVTGADSDAEAITIPFGVTGIGESAFTNHTALRSIAISDSVTSIGNYAFDNCSSLNGVILPNSVTSIGKSAFTRCKSLESITLSDSISTIPAGAFESCDSLRSIIIPENVTSIEQNAFAYCRLLTSVTLPDNVTSIANYAFSTFSTLKFYASLGSSTAITLSRLNYSFGVPVDNYYVFLQYRFSGEEISGIAVTSYVGMIESCTIPDGVTEIASRAFQNRTSLTSIYIPDSVTTIADSAFFGCSGLKSITVPDHVTQIDKSAFTLCNAKRYVNLEADAAKTLSKAGYSFYTDGANYQLKYSFSDNDVSGLLFASCDKDVETITIPSYVTGIGPRAFYGCLNLSSIVFPDNLVDISNDIFSSTPPMLYANIGTSTAITLSKMGFHFRITGANYWLQYVFHENAVPVLEITATDLDAETVTVSDAVTSIGSMAFGNRTSLVELVLPDHITNISANAFYDCNPRIITKINSDTAKTLGRLGISFYPPGENYQLRYIISEAGNHELEFFSADEEAEEILIPSGVTNIGESAFKARKRLSRVSIPDSVVSIGACAFQNCSNLKSITLPDEFQIIEPYVFYDCTSLTSISFPDELTEIGNNAFGNCTSLTDITLPNSLVAIGNGAFGGCSSLTDITLPNSLVAIGNGAFGGCSSLNQIIMPDGVTRIGAGAFTARYIYASMNSPAAMALSKSGHHFRVADGHCDLKYMFDGDAITGLECVSGDKNIDTLEIPYGVTHIRDFAFSSALETCLISRVIFPDSVIYIGESAFAYLKNLSELEIPDSVQMIASGAFYACNNLTRITFADNFSGTVIGPLWFDVHLYATPESISAKTLSKQGFSFRAPDAKYDLIYTFENGEITGLKVQSVDNDIEIANLPDGVTDCSTLFSRKSQLKTVVIPGSVATIPDSAFYFCRNLESLTLSDGCLSIGNSAFDECDSLRTVLIPGSVEHIGNRAFQSCDSLLEVTMESGVQYIGEYAFYSCTNLSTVILPNTLTTIERSAFSNTPALKSLYIPASVTSLGYEPINPNKVDVEVECGSYAYTYFMNKGANFRVRHVWNDPAYEWLENKQQIKASCYCLRDSSHIVEETVSVSADITAEPTCTEMGETTYVSNAFQAEIFTAQTRKLTDIPALGHDWGEPVYIWTEDNQTVHAEHICRRDHSHKETESTDTSFSITKAATCETPGETTYTSNAFKNVAFTAQKKTIANIAALGHSWKETTYTWSNDRLQLTACRTCARDSAHQETETVQNVLDYIVHPTCTESGLADVTSNAFENPAFSVQSKDNEFIPPLGHEWSNTQYIWNEDYTFVTAEHYCLRDSHHTESERVSVSSTITKQPECLIEGERTYTTSGFSNPLFTTQSRKTSIASLGHKPLILKSVEPTCTENGLTEGSRCERCNMTLVAQQTVPAKGHEVITTGSVDPGCTTAGHTGRSYCSVCMETLAESVEIPPVGHKPITVEAIEATTGSSGLTAGSYCETCGIVLEDAMIIPPTAADLGGTVFSDDFGVTYDVNHGIGKENYLYYSDEVNRTSSVVDFHIRIYFDDKEYADLYARKEKGNTSCMTSLGQQGDSLYVPMITIQTGTNGTQVFAAFVISKPGKAGCFASFSDGGGGFSSGGIPVTNRYNIYTGTWKAYYSKRGSSKVYIYDKSPFKDWRIYLESDGTSIDGSLNGSLGIDEWSVNDKKNLVLGGLELINDSDGMIGMYAGIDSNTGLSMYNYYKRTDDSEAAYDIQPYIGTWKAYIAVKDAEGIVVPISELNDSVYKKVYIHSDNTIFIPQNGSLIWGNLTMQGRQFYVNDSKSSFRINQAGQLIRDLNNGITLLYMRLGDDPLPDLAKYIGPWYSYGVFRNTASGMFFADTTGISDYLDVRIQVNLDGTITENFCGKIFNGTWNIENGKLVTEGLYHEISFGTGGILLCDLGNDLYLSCKNTKPVNSSKPAVLPGNLKAIEEESFFASGIRSIVIPASCQKIGKNAFSQCSDLSVIYIPDSITQIEENAFGNSGKLLILCESYNTAAAYAKRNGIHYVVINQ